MLGGHLYELIIVLIIALVVFGPKRLPELGSSLGKGIREFRKATNELQDSINVNHSEPLPPERPTTYTANTQTEYSAPNYGNPEYSAPAAQRPPAAPGEYTAPATPVENQAPRA